MRRDFLGKHLLLQSRGNQQWQSKFLLSPPSCKSVGGGACSSAGSPWRMGSKMPRSPCVPQPPSHPHKPGWHPRTPGHFEALQKLSLCSPGNRSTSSKTFHRFSASLDKCFASQIKCANYIYWWGFKLWCSTYCLNIATLSWSLSFAV